jgi:hypothetical protein
MGTTYQQLFLNGINQSISTLVGGNQPGADPGKTAWTWLTGSSGTQPSQVNEYIRAQITSTSATTQSYSPSKNWATWSSAMNSQFGLATGGVATWLATNYNSLTDDPPVVPEDVISWTKLYLPTGLGVVVAARAASRAVRN